MIPHYALPSETLLGHLLHQEGREKRDRTGEDKTIFQVPFLQTHMKQDRCLSLVSAVMCISSAEQRRNTMVTLALHTSKETNIFVLFSPVKFKPIA